MPNEKTEGILTSAIKTDKITVAFFLVRLKFSIIEAIAVSSMLIPDVTAAKRIKIKNNAPRACAKGNCENISGRDIKIKVGPAVGSTPNEKTIGKIIIPDNNETVVSKPIRVYEDFRIFVSFYI